MTAIASETFKAVVTGEPVQGRDVYKSRVEFRPVAQHLFATNNLPVFAGGMDRGVQRRLLVVQFNRMIPTERVEPSVNALLPKSRSTAGLGRGRCGTADPEPRLLHPGQQQGGTQRLALWRRPRAGLAGRAGRDTAGRGR